MGNLAQVGFMRSNVLSGLSGANRSTEKVTESDLDLAGETPKLLLQFTNLHLLLSIKSKMSAGVDLIHQEWNVLVPYIEEVAAGGHTRYRLTLNASKAIVALTHAAPAQEPDAHVGELPAGTSMVELNSILRHHNDAIWRIVATGYYRATGKPLRKPLAAGEIFECANLEPVSEDQFRLEFVQSSPSDISVLLYLPPERGCSVDLGGYCAIEEIRQTLDLIAAPASPTSEFVVEKTIGSKPYIHPASETDKFHFWIYSATYSLGFTCAEWTILRRLFDKAWSVHEISQQWSELASQFGDL